MLVYEFQARKIKRGSGLMSEILGGKAVPPVPSNPPRA
jgi:hypothetical protein